MDDAKALFFFVLLVFAALLGCRDIHTQEEIGVVESTHLKLNEERRLFVVSTSEKAYWLHKQIQVSEGDTLWNAYQDQRPYLYVCSRDGEFTGRKYCAEVLQTQNSMNKSEITIER